jgi:BirA family biotin operon repressor/biotin-[acetyl-CoA-carboxylase] ligase
MADFQEQGRGRVKGRVWHAEPGETLTFTVLLRYPSLDAAPKAISLRTGLALAEAIEGFAPALAGAVRIKWPNDVLWNGKKLLGILTEVSSGCAAHIGIGVNFSQTRFPRDIADRAVSIALALGDSTPMPGTRLALLEKILASLHLNLEKSDGQWRQELSQRLYKKGEYVKFVKGGADSGLTTGGTLEGIDPDGALVLRTENGRERFVTGELKVY